MNYKDMVFTKEDREALIRNKKHIVDWIMKNIVPNMQADSKIKCDFGETYTSPRSNMKVASYHFYVYSELKDFYSGGGTATNGCIGYGEKFGYMNESFESVTSPYDIYPIVDNWSLIKKTLLHGIEKQKRNKDVIYNFEV